MYTVQFLDHATKYACVYPMKTRDEFIEKLRDLIDVKLKSHGVQIKHYHADGGAELQLLYIVHEKAFEQESCPSVLVGKLWIL